MSVLGWTKKTSKRGSSLYTTHAIVHVHVHVCKYGSCRVTVKINLFQRIIMVLYSINYMYSVNSVNYLQCTYYELVWDRLCVVLTISMTSTSASILSWYKNTAKSFFIWMLLSFTWAMANILIWQERHTLFWWRRNGSNISKPPSSGQHKQSRNTTQKFKDQTINRKQTEQIPNPIQSLTGSQSHTIVVILNRSLIPYGLRQVPNPILLQWSQSRMRQLHVHVQYLSIISLPI